MKRDPVTSSNVAAVGYDDATHTLEVEFKDGSVYQYFAVPESVYNGLRAASQSGESVGHYFDVYVKKAGYGYTRL